MSSSLKVIKARQSVDQHGSAVIKTELRMDDVLEKSEQAAEHELYRQRMEQLLEEAAAEQQAILAAAQAEAKQIREAAQQEGFTTGQRLGLEEGYQAGYQEGMAQAAREAQQLHAQAEQVLADAKLEVSQYYVEKSGEIIELAAEMAERIIHEKIDTSEEKLLPLIMPVLSRMEQQNTFITLTVHPELVKIAKERAKELEAEFPLFRFGVLADASLEKNGCVIESPHAIADLQIKQQLDAMVKDLKELQVAEHV